MRRIILSIALLCAYVSVHAQHSLQVDNGTNTFIISAPLGVGGTYTLPTGGGTLITTGITASSPWLLQGNALSGAGALPTQWFGTSTDDDVILKVNNVEKLRLVSGGNLRVSTNLVVTNNNALALLEATANGNNFIALVARPNMTAGNVVLTLPNDDGTPNQVLQTDGSGLLSWATVGGTGTVTNVAGSGGTTGLTLTGGPITTTGTLTLGGTLGSDNGGTGKTNADLATQIGNALVVNGTGDGYTFASIGGGGSVSDFIFTDGDGFNGTVTLNTTTPTLALTLTDGGVTLSKIADIADNSLLGNSAITPGPVEVITVGSGLSLSAGILSATGSGGTVTNVSATLPLSSSGGATPDISMTQSGTLTDGWLSTVDWNTFNNKQNSLTLGNLTSTDITVTGGTGAVVGAGATLTIANDAITTAKILDANVTPAKITPAGVNSILVTNAGVTQWQAIALAGVFSGDGVASPLSLSNGGVAISKLADVNTGILLGRYTAATGPVQEITVGSGLALSGGGVLSATGSGGTVTSVSVTTANGVSGSVATATTTPAITLTLGAITPSSVAAVGSVTGSNLSGTNTGDQTITLTGNVTGTGTGSFATTIANDAVTYAKMQNVTTNNRLLGRATAGAGDVEEITLGTGLSYTGTTLNATGGTVTSVSVTTANGVSGSVATATTTPAITLTLGAITPSSVASTGTVTGTNLSGTNTGDQTITLTGNVTGTGTGSFATTIANDAVTYAKMQNVTTNNRLLGRATAGAGDVEEITLGTGLSYTGTTLNATGGTVTSVSVTTANGVSGSVATATTTPAITLTLGAITPSSVASTGAVSGTNLSGTNTGDVTLAGENYLSRVNQVITANAVNLSGTNVTGTLAAARFPALTGDVTTSAGSLATTIAADAVTLAKIANAGANSVLVGSGASGSGTNYTEITLGSGLTMTGTVLSSTAGSGSSSVKYKAANETRTNNNTNTNDADISLAMAASDVWTFEGQLIFESTSATPDAQFRFTSSNNATITATYIGRETSDNGNGAGILSCSAATSTNSSSPSTAGTNTTIALTANVPNIVHVTGVVINGGSASTFRLQWAQTTSGGTATTLRAGSYLTFTKQ